MECEEETRGEQQGRLDRTTHSPLLSEGMHGSRCMEGMPGSRCDLKVREGDCESQSQGKGTDGWECEREYELFEWFAVSYSLL
jgi:hypothetical protein